MRGRLSGLKNRLGAGQTSIMGQRSLEVLAGQDGCVSEEPGTDTGEPVVLVQITPSNYRFQAICFIILGSLLMGLPVFLTLVFEDPFRLPLLPLTAVAYGIYCAVRARRQVTRTVLRINRSGLRTDDGLHDHGWAGVVMVWVGSATGLRLPVVHQPVLNVFTGPGLDFAERAGVRPTAQYTIPIGSSWNVPDLCDQLQKITTASIVSGTQVSRRAAASSLTLRTDPERQTQIAQ